MHVEFNRYLSNFSSESDLAKVQSQQETDSNFNSSQHWGHLHASVHVAGQQCQPWAEPDDQELRSPDTLLPFCGWCCKMIWMMSDAAGLASGCLCWHWTIRSSIACGHWSGTLQSTQMPLKQQLLIALSLDVDYSPKPPDLEGGPKGN